MQVAKPTQTMDADPPRVPLVALAQRVLATASVDKTPQHSITTYLADECGVGHNDDGGFGVLRHTPPATVSLQVTEFARMRDHAFDGAAILPVMQPPHSSSVYFVLGQQQFRPHNPLHGNRWSLLGGKRSTRDRDSCDTAAREFCEETCGYMAWNTACEMPLPLRNHHTLAVALRSHKFLACLRMVYNRGGTPRRYDVFLLHVPWDPALPKRFAEFRAACAARHSKQWRVAVRHNHIAFGATGNLKPECAEMAQLGLWSRSQIEQAVVHGNGVLFSAQGTSHHCRSAIVPLLAAVLQQLPNMSRLQRPVAACPPDEAATAEEGACARTSCRIFPVTLYAFQSSIDAT